MRLNKTPSVSGRPRTLVVGIDLDALTHFSRVTVSQEYHCIWSAVEKKMHVSVQKGLERLVDCLELAAALF